jgi:hypothetical protein
MPSFVRPAWLALAFVATAMPASAQTWIYEADVPRPPGYEPRYNYEPRPYEPPTYESRAYAPAVTAAPLALTPAQRTTIYRTIIPQGRGRAPIVRERNCDRVGRASTCRARARRAPRLCLRLRGRLAGRRCWRARANAAGGRRHAVAAVVSIHADQQSPAAGRSGNRDRGGRGHRLATDARR